MPSPLTRRSALLACAATGAAGLAGCGRDPASSGPPVPPPTPAATRRPSSRGPRVPLRLAIPAIAVSTSLVRLGLNEDGTVEVPAAPMSAGWFRLGTVPGQRGSSVILGHVDSVDGPAVFADLPSVGRADRVEVVLSDDTTVTFEVVEVATFANADFPADRVYAGTRRSRELNLVTCGGDYDPARGGYQSNVVVFTRRTAR